MTSGMIPRDRRFTISEAVVARELEGEMVLLDLDSGIYFGLDEVGTRIWQILASGASAAEIADILLGEYEVSPEVLQGDILHLLQELHTKGLVKPEKGPR